MASFICISLAIIAACVTSGEAGQYAEGEGIYCSEKDLRGEKTNALVKQKVDECTGVKVFFEKLQESDVQQIIKMLAKPDFMLLVLRDVKISEQQSEAIMKALASASNVSYLLFRENGPLSIKAATDLSLAMKNNKFKEIDLRNTKLGDQEAALLADALKNTKELTILDIDNCELSADGVKSLAAALKSQPLPLETLHIANNQMGDEGAIALADAIKTLPKGGVLDRVTIKDNSIGIRGRQALREAARSTHVGMYDLRREAIRKSWKDVPEERPEL
jgi:Ran GTPase-activating protein (RanGAP) involved in mRNA processing and transport